LFPALRFKVEERQLLAMQGAVSALLSGLCAALPAPALPLFCPRELEALVCGAPEIDVRLLQRVAEYEGEGVHAKAPHVLFFWESLERMDPAQRARFVNFVCARSSLPASADDFPMSFKIVQPKPEARADPDSHLPSSQVCFFTLGLPFYSSQEVCSRKLLYAVDNATTMDDDFLNREAWGAAT